MADAGTPAAPASATPPTGQSDSDQHDTHEPQGTEGLTGVDETYDLGDEVDVKDCNRTVGYCKLPLSLCAL